MGRVDSVLSSGTAVMAALLVVAVVIIVVLWRRYEELLATHGRLIKEARKESVERSRSTLKGQIAEQMAPLLPGFPYSPADARFIGDPIDYVVFDGCREFRDADSEGEMEVVLLEIKQGQSKLSAVQRAIAGAVEQGRVRFEVVRVGEDGAARVAAWRSGKRQGVAAQTTADEKE